MTPTQCTPPRIQGINKLLPAVSKMLLACIGRGAKNAKNDDQTTNNAKSSTLPITTRWNTHQRREPAQLYPMNTQKGIAQGDTENTQTVQ